MAKEYSQFRAMMAIVKASLVATFRSPQSVFFSLFFPIVLIWIFGSLGGSRMPTVDVAFSSTTDSLNPVYDSLRHNPMLRFADRSKKNIEDELLKGRIAAIIEVKKNPDTSIHSPYTIHLRTSTAAQRDYATLVSVLKTSITEMDRKAYPDLKSTANITEAKMIGRPYRMIDFFLPGMIGFSLIGSAIFGIAFTLYSLKETLVLKRMYSTPIKKQYIILGESLSKVIFNLLTVIVLIAFGHYMYQFTLSNGWITFFNMLVLSFIALLVFMGFGFFVSAIAKTQTVIPIYANLFMFPQYFLSGTFFPKTSLPAFLQPIIKFLPLTAVNDAMRNVAFEGASLASCWPQLAILAGWGIVIYTLTARVFRWD